MPSKKHKRFMKNAVRLHKELKNTQHDKGASTRHHKNELRARAFWGTLSNSLKSNLKSVQMASFDERIVEKVRKKATPSKVTKMTAKVRNAKYALSSFLPGSKGKRIKKLFGPQGQKLGLMVVCPEMFVFASDLKRFFGKLGCKTVFVKNFMFTKSLLQQFYAPELKKFGEFHFKSINLLNAPSKLLIFTTPNVGTLKRKSGYLQYLKKKDHKKHQAILRQLENASPTKVIDLLYKGSWEKSEPGTIRGEIVVKRLKEMGMNNNTEPFTLLDPFGYFKDRAKKGRWPIKNLSGIHNPSTVSELHRNADLLLSNKDLKQIEQATKKQRN